MLVVIKKFYCNLTRPCWGRVKGASLCLIAVGLLAGCQPQGGSSEPLAFGQEPYLRYCASCHGNQGQGKPPTFPPLANSEWLDLGSEAVGLIVLYGLKGEIEVAGRTYRGYMPPMQHISDDDIASILTYMNRDWVGLEAEVSSADIARLRNAFQDPRSPLDGKAGLMEALERLQ